MDVHCNLAVRSGFGGEHRNFTCPAYPHQGREEKGAAHAEGAVFLFGHKLGNCLQCFAAGRPVANGRKAGQPLVHFLSGHFVKSIGVQLRLGILPGVGIIIGFAIFGFRPPVNFFCREDVPDCFFSAVVIAQAVIKQMLPAKPQKPPGRLIGDRKGVAGHRSSIHTAAFGFCGLFHSRLKNFCNGLFPADTGLYKFF